MKWPFGKKPDTQALSDAAMPGAAESVPVPPAKPEKAASEPGKPGLLGRLFSGLAKSSARLAEGVAAIFTKKKLDANTLDELEELLISADLGTHFAARLRAKLAKDRFDKEISESEIKEALASEATQILAPREKTLSVVDNGQLRIMLFVGVNGSGKTTTIGKLAFRWANEGRKVVLAAGDTFRAAAIEQLSVWAERAHCPIIAKAPGADSAALAFEAIEAARAQNADLLLIDTAGRLQNRSELMSELAKIVRVIRKLDPDAPHDVILVLDATVGQNALGQAEAFRSVAGVTGLIMTKLDGTAKGGVLVALAEAQKLPIHCIGVGEAPADLQDFSASQFSRALAGLPAGVLAPDNAA